MVHDAGLAYLPWRELATISLSELTISVDTSQGSNPLFTADRHPVNAKARARLTVSKTEAAILKAVETLPKPYTDASRIEFFQTILEDRLSGCLRSVTLTNWDTDIKNAITKLKEQLDAAVASFGHQVADMGNVEFCQARTDKDTPTLEESGRTHAEAIKRADQEEQANQKITASNKKRDIATSNSAREVKLEKESDTRLELAAEQATDSVRAAKEAALQGAIHDAVSLKEKLDADRVLNGLRYEIEEEKARSDLEKARKARLVEGQARIDQENTFKRHQALEDSKAEVARAEQDADRQFCIARIDHRLIEEAILYRKEILQQNIDFPNADLEVELRRQEIDLRKELILAQAKVMAAAHENTTTTVLADAEAATRVWRAQLDGLAASASVTQFVHSILNDESIMSTASNALGTFLSARAKGERTNPTADGPDNRSPGTDDVDL